MQWPLRNSSDDAFCCALGEEQVFEERVCLPTVERHLSGAIGV